MAQRGDSAAMRAGTRAVTAVGMPGAAMEVAAEAATSEWGGGATIAWLLCVEGAFFGRLGAISL
jgi:hypothetical protein